jgi:RecJ-like exonuclease
LAYRRIKVDGAKVDLAASGQHYPGHAAAPSGDQSARKLNVQPHPIQKQAEKIPCPVCHGKKRVRRQDKVFCNRCQGMGWIEGLFGRVNTCKKCAGNGHFMEFFDEDCLNCESKGWVVRMNLTCTRCGKPQAQCSCAPVAAPGEPV